MINPDAAGIDVGASVHYVAVPPERDEQPVRSFGAFTEDLHQLAQWLEQKAGAARDEAKVWATSGFREKRWNSYPQGFKANPWAEVSKHLRCVITKFVTSHFDGRLGRGGPHENRELDEQQAERFQLRRGGDLTNDLGQGFSYDATGQQAPPGISAAAKSFGP